MVGGVAFLDNYRLASVCDSTIRIWDLDSGICSQTIEIHHTDKGYRHMDPILVAFSTKGKIATCSKGEIKIWDLAHGECLQTTEDVGVVNSMSFLGNDKLVASIKREKIDVWSMEERRWLQTLWPFDTSDHGSISGLRASAAIAISADGQWLTYRANKSHTVKILELGSATIETVTTIQEVSNKKFFETFSPDGQYLASTSGASSGEDIVTITIWEVASGRCLQTITINMLMGTNCSTFSPNNNLFATAIAADPRIFVWDWKNSTELKTFYGPSEIRSIAFSPDGAWLATGSSKGPIQIWDMCTPSTEPPKAHEFGASSVAFMSDGQRLASSAALSFDAPKIWDTLTGVCLQVEPSTKLPRRYPYIPHHVAASTKGQVLASTTFDGGFSIKDLKTGIQSVVLEKDVGLIVLIATSVDGERLMTAALQRGDLVSIGVWDTKMCSCIHKFTRTRGYSQNSFVGAISSDGRRLAFSLSDEILELWNLATNENFSNSVSCDSISFSENGERLGVVSTPSKITIWDTTTGTCLRRCEGIPGPYFSIPWHLDSSFVNVDFTSGTESLIQSRAACLTNYNISPDGGWVMRQSEKLLWLPPEYRPGHATIYKSKIAIGSETGNVIILNLPVPDRGEQYEILPE